MPAHSRTGAERLGDLGLILHGRRGQLEGAGHECGALLLSEGERLHLAQQVTIGVGVVGDVAAGGLAAQPFPHVALGRGGALGQLRRAGRPGGGERLVQTKLVADDDVGSVEGGAKVGHEPAEELVKRRLLDAHVCLLFGRWPPLDVAKAGPTSRTSPRGRRVRG